MKRPIGEITTEDWAQYEALSAELAKAQTRVDELRAEISALQAVQVSEQLKDYNAFKKMLDEFGQNLLYYESETQAQVDAFMAEIMDRVGPVVRLESGSCLGRHNTCIGCFRITYTWDDKYEVVYHSQENGFTKLMVNGELVDETEFDAIYQKQKTTKGSWVDLIRTLPPYLWLLGCLYKVELAYHVPENFPHNVREDGVDFEKT